MRFPVLCQHPDPCLHEVTRPNQNHCGQTSANSCVSCCCCCPQPVSSRPTSQQHQKNICSLQQQQHTCKHQQQYGCPKLSQHQHPCQQSWQQQSSNPQAPCCQSRLGHTYLNSHDQSTTNCNFLNHVNSCPCQFNSSNRILPQHKDRSTSSQSLLSSGSCLHTPIRNASSANHVGTNNSNLLSPKCLHHHLSTCEMPDKNRRNVFHDPAITSLSYQMENGLNCNNHQAPTERLLLSEETVSSSGWYYGKLSWREAEVKLRDTGVGCFLLRDSSDPRYSYSLSVQTPRGPTSVRIQRDPRGFSLDSDPGSDPLVFDTVHELLQNYITLTRVQDRAPDPYTRSATVSREHVWLDSNGSVVAAITLTAPLRQGPPSLQHLARMQVNRDLPLQDVCSFPTNLQRYLDQYPFWC